MTTPGWETWCRERVEEARIFARTNGLPNIQTAMLWRLYANVDDLVERFPDIPLRVALKELAWSAVTADRGDEQRRVKDGE